ncbi:TetR/AcrR family transcriptional regulator [Microbacterium horticulturae]|uniref:TetR/AcrR family transcriptional regulator n=1 Tax=Microbacterium horticulturae TaxID=3028316 RepID=A0ABY8C1W9_9MICO|nr:TetR/AcrR family transcriptional regulator [Microbacterium sp. KACC 23027]WEG09240.1 TetR/AcrR family transcriptional regulator [Microbacterium sp. KACC 23027]
MGMDEHARLPLRERKRQRTRELLMETGRRLFEERGYDETTVADIAAAADIGTRTFFAYFETKEQLLFSDTDPRVTSALSAIDTRKAGELPTEVLLRSLASPQIDAEATNPSSQLRQMLMPHVPAIQARALRLQLEAQQKITAALHDAYPEVDEAELAALVGAFMGAVAATFQFLGDSTTPSARKRRVIAAVSNALTSHRPEP